MGGSAALSSAIDLIEQRLIWEQQAEAFGKQLGKVVAKWPTPVYEPAPSQSTTAPNQWLLNGPNGAPDSVYEHGAEGEALWPLSVMCQLTTSAAVADRSVALEYRDLTGTRFLVAGTQAVVQATSTQSFCWHPQAGGVAWPIEDAALAPLPQQHLYPGQQLAVVVWNAQAGDVIEQVRISARFDPIAG